VTNLVVRTREFGLTVIRLRRSLRGGAVEWATGDQFLQSGLSPGAHFRESLFARSKAEYVSKLSGGLMELEETLYWLELMMIEGIVPPDDAYADWLWNEARELIAIFLSLINKRKG
jgi:four helix bundle protein